MTPRRLIARTISETASCLRLLAPPRAGLRILMYHAIGSPALGDRLGIFSLAPDLFRQHMDHLAAHWPGQTIALAPQMPITEQLQIAITFDDGYQDNLRVAAPILAQRGLPFTVFVTSGFVRDKRPGFLSPAELKELANIPGATIGAHGNQHVALSGCTAQQLQLELASSRAYLEDLTGHTVLTMAYPYGAANQRVRQATAAAGYRLAACSYSDINKPSRDRLLLARTEVQGADSVRVLQQKLVGNWDWYRWRTQDPALS